MIDNATGIQAQLNTKVDKSGLTEPLSIVTEVVRKQTRGFFGLRKNASCKPAQTAVLAGAWTSQTSASARQWYGMTWSPELGIFVVLAFDGLAATQIMTSPDGVTWTSQTSASARQWARVVWSPEQGIFVAVAQDGTVNNQIMTSPDGVTWTSQTSASARQWARVVWSPEQGIFVAVAQDGTVNNQIMTSPDGVTWTSRTSPSARVWESIVWAPELGIFVAVSYDGLITEQVMTSPDGITWTSRSSAYVSQWVSLAWAPELGLLVAVAFNGIFTAEQVMTSTDGITWTYRSSASVRQWTTVVWSPELGIFAAIAQSDAAAGQIMTSPDGITWTSRTAPINKLWTTMAWSPELGIFAACAFNGLVAEQVMISTAGKIDLFNKYGPITTIGQANFSINKLDRLLEWGSKTTIIFKGSNEIPLKIGTAYFSPIADVTISTATDLDAGVISNGKDYYVYACNSSGTLLFKISLASTFPAGFTAVTSRKIGGFHTLCVDVGAIAGHTLTGYLANEILPQSVWDLKHRPRSNPEGMVYSEAISKWVDIYLASGTGASTASVYNAAISDTRDWMDFTDDGGAVKKRLLDDIEFQLIAAGSNEETNITGSADPVTTGGHVDTAARRMISNIGCEDCAGAMWQWLRDQSYRYDGGSHTHVFTGNALATHTHTENQEAIYTQNVQTAGTSGGTPAGSNASVDPAPPFDWYNLPGVKGSIYRQGTYGDIKLLAGGAWDAGTNSGSRSRYATYFRWDSYTNIGARMLAEPL